MNPGGRCERSYLQFLPGDERFVSLSPSLNDATIMGAQISSVLVFPVSCCVSSQEPRDKRDQNFSLQRTLKKFEHPP